MESETLVTISIPTKYGINIYSSRVIDQYNFYKQTLRESGVDIILRYNTTKESDDTFDNISPDTECYNVNDLLDSMYDSSMDDQIHYHMEMYGKEFNSSDNFKIFKMIDDAYLEKYGHNIKDGPVFSKYNELFRKIKIVEKQSADIWKQLNARSRSLIAQFPFSEKFEECYDYLKSPHENDKKIVENLEYVLNGYRQVLVQEKDEKTQLAEDKRQKEAEELKNGLIIKKNQFGQFVYEKYNLVLDPKDKTIIGTSNKMGGVYPLDLPGVQLCQKLKFNYRII